MSSCRRDTWKSALASIPAFLMLFALPVNRESARVIRVISGDTLTIQYKSSWVEIKLLGIETADINLNDKTYEMALKQNTTPEQIIRQGRQAREFLNRLIHNGSQVWIEFDTDKKDRFERLLGYVFLPNGRMLNELMLAEGYAIVASYPPNTKYQARFLIASRQAKDQKKGRWKPAETLPVK